MILALPEELFLNVLYYCDIESIKKLLITCKKNNKIINNNFEHICKNFRNKIDKNFYLTVKERKIDDLKKFLFHNYYLEVRRNLVLSNKSIEKTEFESKAAALGFLQFKNYKYLLKNNYNGFFAHQAVKVVLEKIKKLRLTMQSKNFHEETIKSELIKLEKRQISLLVILKKSHYFTDSSAINLITEIVKGRIRNILGLARVGFNQDEIIQICNNLSGSKIKTLFCLKDLGFLNNHILNLINNYSPDRLNRLIVLRKIGCNQINCITAIENLDLNKLDLLIKVFNITKPNFIWENAYNFVSENSLQYLNDYVTNF